MLPCPLMIIWLPSLCLRLCYRYFHQVLTYSFALVILSLLDCKLLEGNDHDRCDVSLSFPLPMPVLGDWTLLNIHCIIWCKQNFVSRFKCYESRTLKVLLLLQNQEARLIKLDIQHPLILDNLSMDM